ncbi:TIGR03668 family PPOX class F420-dependent oxidoreductase [Pseudonocardia sp. NPDC049635]|uniref:TIGR03668 family PPOX class F420-dependent oxidoreductase n=1 Tax=Pseudonocardia sp. NPDC049635 TaxID=3155506 RepID=UPI0033D9F528
MPALLQSAAAELLASAPVARLATIRHTDGTPRLVPVTFALVESTVVTAVDRVKAKRHTRLARLRDIAADPRVGLLADRYDDDWSQLWWVRVDAVAELHDRGEHHERAVAALVAKYPPYAARPPVDDVLVLTPTRWTGWSAR